MTTLQDALQTILAADYGLNDGDHLKLCDSLKKAWAESAPGPKIKNVHTTTYSIKLTIGDMNYFFDRHVTTYYEGGHGTDIPYTPPTFITEGRVQMYGAVETTKIWRMEMDRVISKILRMHNERGTIILRCCGIETRWSYNRFLRQVMKTDELEKKAREKYGAMDEDGMESDECIWRGDYTYPRYIVAIVDALKYGAT